MLWYLELVILACVTTGILSALRNEVWLPSLLQATPLHNTTQSSPYIWATLSDCANGALLPEKRRGGNIPMNCSRMELAGGKSGPSGLRRSSERREPSEQNDRHSSTTSGLNGLRNIGNTCFMNSVVQCLSNTRPLLEYVTQDKYTTEINTSLSCMKGALMKAFASVLKELWRSGEKDSVVNTTTLKSQVQRFAPRFMGYSQQDAQEFLRYLLEGLHEDVNRVTTRPKPILTEIDDNLSDTAKANEAWSRYVRMEDSRVGDIFMGQLKSTLRCTHCKHDSVTFDPFWDLSLPIPSRTGNLKLQQCLQHFVREEELDGDEKPTCSKCGVRRKCLKWFTVQKFPKVLVLHLKRFSPTERFRGKLNVLVEFPLNGLDMSPLSANNTTATYNLYALSNHSGTTYSGHYTAYCKHPYSGDWHEYNDSRVSPINPRDVVSPEAYVLFYELADNS
ncbi:ubiquitin carboxyl-terminal hydrolase 2-like isoform X3 [Leptidea sinapis]|uniref:ubiquitin carboxyl-terminal hydrolase 2-like isoform X3 n=1 Tax=Leptidea sinapis TaxID=189913 RepID=UPI00212CE22F|nr:ubiquitin carboxyl-terminal hydrolase 2-like isoform X3 [Leptidea sinapis]